MESLITTIKLANLLCHNPKLSDHFTELFYHYFWNWKGLFSLLTVSSLSSFPYLTVRFRHWRGLSPPHLRPLWTWAPRIQPIPLPPPPPTLLPQLFSLWYVVMWPVINSVNSIRVLKFTRKKKKAIFKNHQNNSLSLSSLPEAQTFDIWLILTYCSLAHSLLQITASIWTSGEFQSPKLSWTPPPLRTHHIPTHSPTAS